MFSMVTAPVMAAVPGFTELPNLTAYLECRAVTCKMSDMEDEAQQYATARGNGVTQYLLGNVATGELELVHVRY